jgi:hypothetical protein
MAEENNKDNKLTKPRTTTNTTTYEIRGNSQVPKTGNTPKPIEKK